ncbi:hypothetical protein DFH07DRAFT_843085 [Mycena maculata]|uniref:Secreted protein n=1 Tax=Mycena maculata TaxID=230809 RepID=A0AAD7MX85_9AGAR|nr:hypothetical protein DFH07DRAFT_843085 [Mycena maculata]
MALTRNPQGLKLECTILMLLSVCVDSVVSKLYSSSKSASCQAARGQRWLTGNNASHQAVQKPTRQSHGSWPVTLGLCSLLSFCSVKSYPCKIIATVA